MSRGATNVDLVWYVVFLVMGMIVSAAITVPIRDAHWQRAAVAQGAADFIPYSDGSVEFQWKPQQDH